MAMEWAYKNKIFLFTPLDAIKNCGVILDTLLCYW